MPRLNEKEKSITRKMKDNLGEESFNYAGQSQLWEGPYQLFSMQITNDEKANVHTER